MIFEELFLFPCLWYQQIDVKNVLLIYAITLQLTEVLFLREKQFSSGTNDGPLSLILMCVKMV